MNIWPLLLAFFAIGGFFGLLLWLLIRQRQPNNLSGSRSNNQISTQPQIIRKLVEVAAVNGLIYLWSLYREIGWAGLVFYAVIFNCLLAVYWFLIRQR